MRFKLTEVDWGPNALHVREDWREVVRIEYLDDANPPRSLGTVRFIRKNQIRTVWVVFVFPSGVVMVFLFVLVIGSI